MKDHKIYIQLYNADAGKEDWLEFNTNEDLEFLMEKQMIDFDDLGYAMDDQAAFDEVLELMSESTGPWSYSKIVNAYLDRTDHEIRIRA